MSCKRCREVKKDMVRVDNLFICSDCINLIVMEWDVKTEDTNDRVGYALRPCSALPSGLMVSGGSVKFTLAAA